MAETARTDGERRGYELLREVALTGVAVVVPAVISAYVLVVLFGLISRLLGPVVAVIPGDSGLVQRLLAAGALVGLVLIVGFVAHFRTGKRAIDYFDAAMGRVPGLGTVYRSFRRMSDIMLEGTFGGTVWQLPDIREVRELDVEDLRELDVDDLEERLLGDGDDADRGGEP